MIEFISDFLELVSNVFENGSKYETNIKKRNLYFFVAITLLVVSSLISVIYIN